MLRSGGAVCTACRELGSRLQAVESCMKKKDGHEKRTRFDVGEGGWSVIDC